VTKKLNPNNVFQGESTPILVFVAKSKLYTNPSFLVDFQTLVSAPSISRFTLIQSLYL